MNQPIQEIIRQRYSCRSYIDEPIQETHRDALKDFLGTLQIGPMGTHARFKLVTATQNDRQSLKGLGTYGFIRNPIGFIIGAVEQGRKDLKTTGIFLSMQFLLPPILA